MDNLNVILDVEGLVTYPHFESDIIVPLEQRGVNIRFWSLAPKDRVSQLLTLMDLDRYIGTSINQDDTTSLYDQIGSSLGEKKFQYYRPGLESWFTRINPGVHYDDAYMAHYAEKFFHVRGNIGINIKYPPLLGEGSYLLVESDNAYVNGDGSIRTGKLEYTIHQKVSRDSGFSVVYVPEHPEVWNFDFKPRLTPEEVTMHIQRAALVWDGKQFTKDIGESTGLYRDQRSHHPEK